MIDAKQQERDDSMEAREEIKMFLALSAEDVLGRGEVVRGDKFRKLSSQELRTLAVEAVEDAWRELRECFSTNNYTLALAVLSLLTSRVAYWNVKFSNGSMACEHESIKQVCAMLMANFHFLKGE